MTGSNPVTKKVQIILEHIVQGEEKIAKAVKNYQKMGREYKNITASMVSGAMRQVNSDNLAAKKRKFLAEWSDKLGVNTNRVNQIMSDQGIVFSKTGRVTDGAGRKVGDLNKIMKTGEINTRRFNMSLLSTMFAGMALQRSMSKLLQPAAQASGIFEVFADTLESVFSPIMELILPVVEAITDWMDRWSDGTKAVVGGIVLFLFVGGMMLALVGQLGLGYMGLSVMLGQLTISLSGATTGMYTFGTAAVTSGTAAQVALAPFLIIAYAIIAAITLIVIIFYKWEDISNALGEVFGFIKDTFSGLINGIEKFKIVILILMAIFAPLYLIIYGIVYLFRNWGDVTNKIGEVFKMFGSTIRMVITSAVLFFGWLGDRMEGLKERSSSIWTSITDWIKEVWGGITSWLSEKWEWITSLFTWENIKSALMAIWQFFVNIWNTILGVIKTVWDAIWGFLKPILSAIWDFIVTIFNAIWDTIKTILGIIWGVIKTVWDAIWGTIKTVLSAIWETIKFVWDNIWNTIKTVIGFIWDTIKSVFTTIWDFIKNTWNSISDLLSGIWNGIKDVAVSVWQGIKDTIKGAINGILGFINILTGAWNSLSFTVPKVKVGKFTFGGWTVGVPKIPSIPMLAQGGIVTQPTTAIIGESGPEAVVPLNKGFGEKTINFSPTYNITVADKNEFERMIKYNNSKLVEELRRRVND